MFVNKVFFSLIIISKKKKQQQKRIKIYLKVGNKRYKHKLSLSIMFVSPKHRVKEIRAGKVVRNAICAWTFLGRICIYITSVLEYAFISHIYFQ